MSYRWTMPVSWCPALRRAGLLELFYARDPVAKRDSLVDHELARRLVGKPALGIELGLRQADQNLRPDQQKSVELRQDLAQLVLPGHAALNSRTCADHRHRLVYKRMIRH